MLVKKETIKGKYHRTYSVKCLAGDFHLFGKMAKKETRSHSRVYVRKVVPGDIIFIEGRITKWKIITEDQDIFYLGYVGRQNWSNDKISVVNAYVVKSNHTDPNHPYMSLQRIKEHNAYKIMTMFLTSK